MPNIKPNERPKEHNLTNDELEELTTSAFVKEIQSDQYQNDYTPERRLKTLSAFRCVIELIQNIKK